MAAYLISYDLNRPKQEYKDLHQVIKNIASAWWHQLDSTWIINHQGTATQIRNRLKRYMDENDELIVVELAGEVAWCGFNEKGSSWLKKHLE